MQDNSEETAAHFLRVAASFNWSVKRTSNSGLRPLLDVRLPSTRRQAKRSYRAELISFPDESQRGSSDASGRWLGARGNTR